MKIIEHPDPIHSIRESLLAEKYHQFVKSILKPLRKDYHTKPKYMGMDTEFEDNIESALENNAMLLRYDFFNDSALATTISLSEIIDQITDGEDDESQNCIVLSSHNFVHPYNWLLSPAALAVSFFNFQMKQLKKSKQNASVYSKSTLPAVTYLSLTGIFSGIDIDILHHSSDRVQTIVIYDENTGPAILKKESRFKKEHKSAWDYQEMSDKILLLPLECTRTEKDRKKDYNSSDLLQIIENFVVPSITKFRPAYIVLNCSLIFDNESNQTPFSLTEEALAYIVQLLLKLDCKVIVYPFKFPNFRDLEVKKYFEKAWKDISPKDDHNRLNYITERYGIPYNELYLRDCVVSIFEVLSSKNLRNLL